MITKDKASEDSALCEMANVFADKMLDRLLTKLEQGFSGWDDVKNRDYIFGRLLRAIDEHKWVDVGNFAAMLWNMEQS